MMIVKDDIIGLISWCTSSANYSEHQGFQSIAQELLNFFKYKYLVSSKPTIVIAQRYYFIDRLGVDTLCLLRMHVKSYTSEMQPLNI